MTVSSQRPRTVVTHGARLRRLEALAAKADGLSSRAAPVHIDHRVESTMSQQAEHAVRSGTASMREYALVCWKEVEAYRLGCLAYAPLLVAGLISGFQMADDRRAIAHPPDVEVPEPVTRLLGFQEWLASAAPDELRAYRGADLAKAARVSASARARAAVTMLVLGDANATKFRLQLWSATGDAWAIGRPTWAPSELTVLSAETFEALLGPGAEGKVRQAVSNGDIQESTYRLEIANVVRLILDQAWEGPDTRPPWSTKVKIGHPPPRSGYKEYPSHIGYTY